MTLAYFAIQTTLHIALAAVMLALAKELSP